MNGFGALTYHWYGYLNEAQWPYGDEHQSEGPTLCLFLLGFGISYSNHISIF